MMLGHVVAVVNCFEKCLFHLNDVIDYKDATGCSIAEDDWGHLNAGVLS
jgi:hypothetical protein